MSHHARHPHSPGHHAPKTTPLAPAAERTPARSFLDTRRAAKVLGMSSRTLEKWRGLGTGPPFLKLGRRVLYSTTDLEAWIRSRRRNSTSEG